MTFPLYVEVDEIYNLACPASPIHYQFDPVQTTKTSVVGAINMLGLAKRTKAKVLQASTSEVYGDPEVHPQTEAYRGNVNPLGSRACYDESKRCAETLFFDYHRQHPTRIKVVASSTRCRRTTQRSVARTSGSLGAFWAGSRSLISRWGSSGRSRISIRCLRGQRMADARPATTSLVSHPTTPAPSVPKIREGMARSTIRGKGRAGRDFGTGRARKWVSSEVWPFSASTCDVNVPGGGGNSACLTVGRGGVGASTDIDRQQRTHRWPGLTAVG